MEELLFVILSTDVAESFFIKLAFPTILTISYNIGMSRFITRVNINNIIIYTNNKSSNESSPVWL